MHTLYKTEGSCLDCFCPPVGRQWGWSLLGDSGIKNTIKRQEWSSRGEGCQSLFLCRSLMAASLLEGSQLQPLGHIVSLLCMMVSCIAQLVLELLWVKNGVLENKDVCSERMVGKLCGQPSWDRSEEMAVSICPHRPEEMASPQMELLGLLQRLYFLLRNWELC